MISEQNKSATSLAEYFRSVGLIGGDGFSEVYPNDTLPSDTDRWPESFVEIKGNGPVRTNFSRFGILDFVLSVELNVKLKSDGGTNEVRENFLADQFDKLFIDTVTVGKNHYSINKNNLVYSGKDLLSGYSSKIININVKIY